MVKPTGRKLFLARLRNSGTATQPQKVVNSRLETMLDSMMEEATAENSPLTFDQKMAVGALVLKLEAVRNKLQDEDYGAGFNEPVARPAKEPAEDEPDERSE